MTTRGKFVLGTENPLDKYTDDTPWGTVLYQKFKSGLGILQTNLLQLGKLVAEGKNETEKIINKTFFPKMEENLIKLQEAYGKNPDADWVLDGLEGLIDASTKMQQAASEAGEAKDPLKKFIGTGVEAVPPIGGAVFLAGVITPMSKLAQAKIGGAKVAEFWNSIRRMIPFASTAGAQTTSQLEITDPELPYLKKIAAGALTGIGEAATELPVYISLTKLLKAPGKILVNKGAKAIFDSGLVKWLWTGLGQVAQEPAMEPISMSILQAIGVKQDWNTLPQNMIQATYDGCAMVVVTAGLGSMSVKAQKLVLNKIEKDNPSIPDTIKLIREVSKALPPKAEALAPKPVQLYREQAETSRKEVVRLEERLKTAPKSMEEGLLYDVSLQKQRAETYERKVIDKGTFIPDTVSSGAIEGYFAEREQTDPSITDVGTAEILRGTKGKTADDIMKEYPDIKLKKDVSIKELDGTKTILKKGEQLTPYELKGGKVLLQDGETYIVSKNVAQNLFGQAIKSGEEGFAPELKGTIKTEFAEETPELQAIQDFIEKVRKKKGSWDVDKLTLEESSKYQELLSAKSGIELPQYGAANYNEPGGTDYKEVTTQVYDDTAEKELAEFDKRLKKKYNTNIPVKIYEMTLEEETEYNKLTDAITYKEKFNSMHFPEYSDKVFWHRRDMRVDTKGNKVFFLEEIQSDWIKSLNKANREYKKWAEHDFKSPVNEEIKKRLFAKTEAGGAHTSSLLKNWAESAIKVALQDAVGSGAKYFSWTTAQQQKDRWSLEKQLSAIYWDSAERGRPDLNKGEIEVILQIRDAGGQQYIIVNETGTVVDADEPLERLLNKDIEEVFPKNIADQIMNEKEGELKGEGLKIGGGWAENLYDRKIPSVVRKLTGQEIQDITLKAPVEGTSNIILNDIMVSMPELGSTIRSDNYAGEWIVISLDMEHANVGVLSKTEIDNIERQQEQGIITAQQKFELIGDAKLKILPMEKTSIKNNYPVQEITQKGIEITQEVKDIVMGGEIKTSGKKFKPSGVESTILAGEDIDDTPDFSEQPLENILDLIDTGQELSEEGTGEYEFPEEDVSVEGFDVESVGTPQFEENIGQLQIQEGTGETATRGAALSIEEKAVANKVIEGFDNLPTYEKVTAENQIKNGTRILQDPARAERIAMGEEVCPADTLPEIVMGLVEHKANQEGNTELIWELAHNSKLLAEETTMGQRIWALSLRDIFSPVKTIRKLIQTQEKAYTERGKGDYKKDKQKETEAINKKIEKTKEAPNKVTEAIDRGELNPEELISKSSQERRKIFEPLVGEKKATEINADFENKLTLKNQQKGLEDWADNIKNKKVKKDILDKIKKMDKLLEQKNMKRFLEDLIARKLGVGVTMEQAKQVSKLSKTAYDAKKVMEASPRRGHLEKATETELNYGRARVLFRNYINNLKEHAQKLTLMERLEPYNWWDSIKMIAGIAKSAKSTFDNSGLLRQNLKTFWTNPRLWNNNAIQSWEDIVNVLRNKQVQDMIDADIFSRPNFDKYVKDELAINVIEEEFPYSDVLEGIPILGKIHLAAETAFTGLAKRNRVDFYDYFLKIATEQGQTPKGLGRMVNSLTGRGHLGAWEGAADAINVTFFSMRFFKSNVDFLTAHAFDSKVDAWTKKQAAKNLLKAVVGTAAVLAMAKALVPDSVEEDRTSANYGKIKIGNTRFDVTGGMGSLITLSSRLIPVIWGEGQMKSSTTGIITKLNADTFNASTGLDMFYNFFENKLSPVAGLVRDLGRGRNFQGEKPTPLSQLTDLFVPIIIQEFSELKADPHSADILLALIAEGVGIGINTYSAEVDWDYKQGKVLKQFKEEVGDTKYYEANIKFNKEWLEWFNEIVKHPKYRAMSEEDKQKTITFKKAKIKSKIFRKYRFKYKIGE